MSALVQSYNKEAIRKATLSSIAIYLSVYIALPFLGGANQRLYGACLGLLYVIPVVFALSASAWASKNTSSYKRLWKFMAIGMSFWSIGASIVAIYSGLLGPTNIPSPSIADIFSIGYLPIMLGIIISIGKIRPPFDPEKKQFLTNISMLALAMFLLCYRFILIPAWFSNPDMNLAERIYTIAYPMYDWIIMVSLLLASYRLRGTRIEGWVVFLIASFSFSILADVASYIIGYWMHPVVILCLAISAILVGISSIDEVTGALLGVRTRTNKPVVDLPDMLLAQKPLRVIIVPLVSTMTIPAVWLASAQDKHVSETSVMVIASFAIITLSIYRSHLLAVDNALLAAKVLRDSLTGLNNHRYFQETLAKSVTKARRSRKPVSLIIADVDDFAQVNDIYGHAFGDKVLTVIARTIMLNLRESDEACRLGGDEFGIILPKTGKTEAYIFAEYLKEAVTASLKSTFPEKAFSITLGVSTFPALSTSKDDLVQTAEGALYWAKFHGKNIVFLYDPEVVEVLNAEERASKAEERSFLDTVRSLAVAVDARDQYTRLHSQGVSIMAAKLSKQIGLDKKRISEIEAAGLLHDVGKIGMPDNILGKPGRLTNEEMEIVKNHPVLSGQILQSTSLKHMVPAVRSHHERWDGKGYPDGLKGEEIPLEARILAIADTFDAMTTDRPYRKALPTEEAVAEVKRCAGSQFDPKLVAAFLTLFSDSSVTPEFDSDDAESVRPLEAGEEAEAVEVGYGLATGS